MADPLIGTGPVPDGAVVLDIRSEDKCSRGSLPAARCLPASALLGVEGAAPVSFHALRWLLGTVGLGGTETVAVVGEDADDRLAVAGLLVLAGQARVHVIESVPSSLTLPGEGRSMSREAVYTAPMRDNMMTLNTNAQPLGPQLAALAQSGRPVAFPYDH